MRSRIKSEDDMFTNLVSGLSRLVLGICVFELAVLDRS